MEQKYIKKILLVLILVIINSIYARQEFDFDKVKGIALDILYNKELEIAELNPKNINNISFYFDDFTIQEGSFLIEIRSVNNELLFKKYINLNHGRNFIIVPYFLNIGSIKIFNEEGKKILDLGLKNVEFVNLCNENRVCENGEVELCPLDCKTAKNPDYPLTPTMAKSNEILSILEKNQSKEIKEIPEFTQEISKKQFILYLFILGGTIVFLSLVFAILYIKKR